MGQIPLVIPPRTVENAERWDRVILSFTLFPPRGRTPLMLLSQLFVCRKRGHDWLPLSEGTAHGRACRRCFKGEWA